ncbi:MAG: BatA and WFA domain-containing protein [Gemmatimonadaceae bacterium]|nr:BatA and WFA domain-containing protein [Gemmatimonadaceae bacterium]
MPLLAPLFLIGLAAVAIPLLVHLVQREKRDPVAFPSLMFLERTVAPFTARRNLRDPWLFVLRALAVMALVLAFARPVLGPRPVVGGADLRRREVVVLVDRSFSMRLGDRWPRARAAVDSVIRGLAQGDRMTLVAFDRRAAAVTAATGDKATLLAGLNALTPTDDATRLAPAVAIAQQRIATSDAPRKVLVVVSDFQRSGWDLTDEFSLPAGTELVTVDVRGDSAVTDRAVRSVEVQRDRRPGPAQAIVTARVTNAGPAARGVVASLEIGGRIVEQRSVDLPRDGGATVSFAAVPMPPHQLLRVCCWRRMRCPAMTCFIFSCTRHRCCRYCWSRAVPVRFSRGHWRSVTRRGSTS